MKAQYIAAGYGADLDNLLKAFSDAKTLRFSDFSQYWRDKKFSFIFCGKVSENELHEFLDEVYLITLAEMKEDNDMTRRVGALYTLYGIYFKQPLPSKVPIRVTLETWPHIQNLITFARDNFHDDVCHIWKKLQSAGAIHFVHTPRPCGPSYIRNYKLIDDEHDGACDDGDHWKESLHQLMSDLSEIQGQYNDMKQVQAESEIRDLKLIDDAFFNHLRIMVNGVAVKSERPTEMTTPTHEIVDCKEDSEDIGERRRRLKNRAIAETV